jgi:hypothetical protein
VRARIEPVGQLRREKLRELTKVLWWRLTMLLVPIAAGVAAALIVSANGVAGFFIGAAVIAVALAIGTVALADSRAKSAFLEAWATARGWSAGSADWVEEATPLLRDGDRRDSEHHIAGPLPGGEPAVLCHYTYEVRRTSTSSNGATSTSWEDYPFTVVETRVSAPGLPVLSLHPRSFGDNRLFDRIDSAVTRNRVAALESAELEHAYKLEVADEVSDLAVRRVFEPSFIVWCIDQAPDEMLFELENDVLVVAIPDHSYDAAELDNLVEKASTIAAALAGVHSPSGVS